jgi:hypothetical protein
MDLSNAKLPPVYERNQKKYYFDPIRKRLIQVTPEETVRQRVISYLLDELKVPADMIRVEEHLSHYGLDSKGRADIIIEAINKDNLLFPLTVIECKSDKTYLDKRAMDQVLDYSDALGSIYTLLTNGGTYFCYKFDLTTNQYVLIEDLPDYQSMLTGDCVELPEIGPFERIPFESLRSFILETREKNEYSEISKDTPLEIAVPILNLWECLCDTSVTIPVGKYGLFEIIKDLGVRMLTYGNASGGIFYGPYRSFLVQVDGDTEIFSIGISNYMTWAESKKEDGKFMTSINVAHDDEKTSHHSLQLLVDKDVVLTKKKIRIYHNGRIAIGRIGSGKKAELRELVAKRYPKILQNDKYYLGGFTSDRPLYLDNPDVIDLIVNLISYAIVRDEYREIVKAVKA